MTKKQPVKIVRGEDGCVANCLSRHYRYRWLFCWLPPQATLGCQSMEPKHSPEVVRACRIHSRLQPPAADRREKCRDTAFSNTTPFVMPKHVYEYVGKQVFWNVNISSNDASLDFPFHYKKVGLHDRALSNKQARTGTQR